MLLIVLQLEPVLNPLPYLNQEMMCEVFLNLRSHGHETHSLPIDALLNPLSLI